MINNKQGLSGIVVTLIIIGIALAAVGIVFYVISTVTEGQADTVIDASGDLNTICTALTPAQFEVTTALPTCTGVVSYHGGQKCCSVAPSGT